MMKNLILTSFLSCFIGFSICSQEKIQEFHVNSNLSFLYKQQFSSNENFLWTVGLPRLSFSYQETTSNTTNKQLSFNSGLGFGLEFRAPFNDVVSLYHGPSLNGIYNLSRTSSFPTYGIGCSFIYNVGLMFKINNHFLISAQISPSFTYMFAQTTHNNSQANSIAISLREFPLSGGLVYRF